MINYPIVRGILIGGAVGVFAVIFDIVDSMPRAFGLGMLAGALAGLTMKWRQRRHTKIQKAQDESTDK